MFSSVFIVVALHCTLFFNLMLLVASINAVFSRKRSISKGCNFSYVSDQTTHDWLVKYSAIVKSLGLPDVTFGYVWVILVVLKKMFFSEFLTGFQLTELDQKRSSYLIVLQMMNTDLCIGFAFPCFLCLLGQTITWYFQTWLEKLDRSTGTMTTYDCWIVLRRLSINVMNLIES